MFTAAGYVYIRNLLGTRILRYLLHNFIDHETMQERAQNHFSFVLFLSALFCINLIMGIFATG